MTDKIFGRHIVQYPPDYSLCAGCTTCEIVCSLVHDGVVGPRYNRVFLKRGTSNMLHTVLVCMHCEDHPCYERCPKRDEAMCLDGEHGIVYIDEENCIGCGACVRACKFSPSRINLIKSKDRALRKAKKCDLCRTREEGPACIEWCPVRCLGLSDRPRPVFEPPQMPGPPPGAPPGPPPGAPPGPPPDSGSGGPPDSVSGVSEGPVPEDLGGSEQGGVSDGGE
ncbi:MAG: 4Fe-4S dicluster domain-containing protein [Coriobacteriales bacterium]|jgi:Fe-S-cluster-containing hydrogenase component 2|nr:4Fe-4S dicluster domain-containing protein [Coriobacteriales bacterium]